MVRSVYGRSDATTTVPSAMGGTKCPSMMSMWMMSAWLMHELDLIGQVREVG